MRVVTIDVPPLGNRTHLVHDGRVGVVIDPPHDFSPVEEAAERAGVDIVAVAATHLHDDHASGGLRLSWRHGAEYLVAADEDVEFARIGVHDNETFAFGDIDLRAIATPGHTPLHLSYLATDATAEADEPGVLFSGGSLLHGSVGRTDLFDPTLTVPLTRAQWLSTRRLGALPADTLLFPTHGVDSFQESPTVGDERRGNPVLHMSHEQFVTTLERRPDHRIDGDGILEALARGAHVIDVRSSAAYAAGHLPGTLSVPAGQQCAVYAGWVTPSGAELVLAADSEDELDHLVPELAAIGIESVGTALLDPSMAERGTGLRRTDWAGFVSAPPGAGSVVIDVRRPDEWCAGHLPTARNIPVHELPHRLEEIPLGEVWVHCAAGYRATVAAGLLDRAGREVVLVDDDFARVEELGIPLQRGRAAA